MIDRPPLPNTSRCSYLPGEGWVTRTDGEFIRTITDGESWIEPASETDPLFAADVLEIYEWFGPSVPDHGCLLRPSLVRKIRAANPTERRAIAKEHGLTAKQVQHVKERKQAAWVKDEARA